MSSGLRARLRQLMGAHLGSTKPTRPCAYLFRFVVRPHVLRAAIQAHNLLEVDSRTSDDRIRWLAGADQCSTCSFNRSSLLPSVPSIRQGVAGVVFVVPVIVSAPLVVPAPEAETEDGIICQYLGEYSMQQPVGGHPRHCGGACVHVMYHAPCSSGAERQKASEVACKRLSLVPCRR